MVSAMYKKNLDIRILRRDLDSFMDVNNYLEKMFEHLLPHVCFDICMTKKGDNNRYDNK